MQCTTVKQDAPFSFFLSYPSTASKVCRRTLPQIMQNVISESVKHGEHSENASLLLNFQQCIQSTHNLCSRIRNCTSFQSDSCQTLISDTACIVCLGSSIYRTQYSAYMDRDVKNEQTKRQNISKRCDYNHLLFDNYAIQNDI